ncbi:MAG: GNAT family N-acetyltransferase [Deltaproteobacteria bacterium]|nr:GNAT family N-acetyltransferase [Deltaproteobacteria bacterium]MBW2658468.1 GNAT family N-acetyltransferase [Deltaproteobacteria bacterium]
MNKENSQVIIDWRWSSFEELSSPELYAILKLRQEIFVVEQKCIYLDCDGLDQNSWHLRGMISTGSRYTLGTYLRVIPPGPVKRYPAIGRLLTRKKLRHKAIAGRLLEQAISRINKIYPGSPIQISAQLHLEPFYNGFKFFSTSAPYDEDGIAHIEMIKNR